MQLGVSKINITPSKKIRLAGYANRLEPFIDVLHDIYTVVYYFRTSKEDKVIIYGDLLWWGSDFIDTMNKRISQKYNIRYEDIVFTASHNHSGPGTSENFTELLEEVDYEYLRELQDNVLTAIHESQKKLQEVNLKKAEYYLDLNVYRRVTIDNEIKMMPNLEVEVDKTVTLLKFVNQEDEPIGFIVHYPCHANVANINYVNGDYPGVLMELLDNHYNTTSMFMQGCTGDIRPKIIVGNEFFSGDIEKVEQFANQFYDSIITQEERLKYEDIELDELTVKKHMLNLDIDLYLNNQELEKELTSEDELKSQWSKVITKKKNRDYETLIITEIRLGKELTILGYNGEMSDEYSRYAGKITNKDVLSIGYTNGMIGYIPTAIQLNEGGYEPEGSTWYFALSGQLKSKNEEKIKEKIRKILED
ncbi:neutral/alkaline non-lysosomal ceramidase N-terminal domain-containing protein [Vallitalea sediminicola]